MFNDIDLEACLWPGFVSIDFMSLTLNTVMLEPKHRGDTKTQRNFPTLYLSLV